MKRILVLGALVLGLVACGGTSTPGNSGSGSTGGSAGGNTGGSTGGGSTGSVTYPYNPAPSAAESGDTRVPYLGDWAWVAKLPDGTYRQGVVSIKTRGTPTDRAKNGGVGPGYLCLDDTCVTRYDASTGVINTAIVDGQARLGAVYVDPSSTTTPPTNRLGVLDTDSKVTLNAQNNPVLAGTGMWVEVTGQPAQTVKAAFVQMDSTPGDDIFSVPRAEAFKQARAAAEAVTAQQVNTSSLLGLPQMAPALR